MVQQFQVNKKLFFLFCIIGAVLYFVPGSGLVLYFYLIYHALRGPRQIIEALTLMFFLLMSNSALFDGGNGGLRWFVFFAAFFRSMFDNFKGKSLMTGSNWPVMSIWIFFFILLPVSMYTSQMATISTFKLIAFTIGTVSIMTAFKQTAHLRQYWDEWFTSFFLFIIAGSSVLYLLGMGFERNGAGFQGVLSHPQSMGPIAAIMTAWLAGKYLFGHQRGKILVASILFGLLFIYASQARTAAFSFLGAFIGGTLVFWFQGRSLPQTARTRQMMIYAFFSLIILSALNPEELNSFLKKPKEGEVIEGTINPFEILQESRGSLMERSMNNFREYPITGIGLGVPTEYQYGIRSKKLKTMFGFPVGASVEKGFLPTAVLEEIGLIGAILTSLILIILINTLISSRNFTSLWIFFCAILVNMGESVFFSLSGVGLFVWLTIGLAYNMGLHQLYEAQALRKRRLQYPYPQNLATQ